MISCLRLLITTLLIVATVSVSAQGKNYTTIKGRKIEIAALENFISSRMDSLRVPGLSIALINDRRVVYYNNFGVTNMQTQEPVNPRTMFEACSLSKPVFAYFVLRLAREQVLNLDYPLYTYFIDSEIEYSDDRFKFLTARMVLNHASGFANWRSRNESKLRFNFVPGTAYGYSGEGYQHLKRVLTYILNITDRKLEDYFQEEVVEALHLSAINFVWQDSLARLKAFGHRNGLATDNGPHGLPDQFDTAGGLLTTAAEYARFLVKLMDKNDALASQLLALQTSLPKEPDGSYRSLGFSHTLFNGAEKYYHTGNNGDARAYCHFYTNEGLGIVMFSNCDNFFSSSFANKILEYLDEEILR